MSLVLGNEFAMEVMQALGIPHDRVTYFGIDSRINRPLTIHIARAVQDDEAEKIRSIFEQYAVTKESDE